MYPFKEFSDRVKEYKKRLRREKARIRNEKRRERLKEAASNNDAQAIEKVEEMRKAATERAAKRRKVTKSSRKKTCEIVKK